MRKSIYLSNPLAASAKSIRPIAKSQANGKASVRRASSNIDKALNDNARDSRPTKRQYFHNKHPLYLVGKCHSLSTRFTLPNACFYVLPLDGDFRDSRPMFHNYILRVKIEVFVARCVSNSMIANKIVLA